MKKCTVWAVLAAIALTGCSAKKLDQLDLDAAKQTDLATDRCYAAIAAQHTSMSTVIKSVRAEDRTMLAYAYVTGQNTALLVSAATGNSIDPCKGDNLWSYRKAEVEAKNKAVAAGIKEGGGVLKWFAGAWTINKVTSKFGTSYTSEGMSTTSVTNQSDSFNTNTSQQDSLNTYTDKE